MKFLNRLGPRLLVVTAVDAERAAVVRGLGIEDRPAAAAIEAGERVVVVAGGVGPAAAAAATASALAVAEVRNAAFALVISAGIAGGFVARAGLGTTVLATRSIAADLGADSDNGFLGLDSLGFGAAALDADADVLEALRHRLPDALCGEVLTVSTVTGTAQRAAVLAERHPDALAEGMEGFGVASAADQAGVAFAEIRTIANPVGPRDRGAWRIEDALRALADAATAVASLER